MGSLQKIPADIMSVLVVDDHDAMREMFATALHRRGCRCETASGGTRALQALSNAQRDGDRHFDIVLLDLFMDDMNGFEVIRRARELGLDPHFVMMSADATVENRRTAHGLGVRQFMAKPVELPEMWRLLLRERQLGKPERHAFSNLPATTMTPVRAPTRSAATRSPEPVTAHVGT